MGGYNSLSEGHIETLTGFEAVIQSDHSYIHQGLAHTYSVVKTLASGDTYNCVVTTPSNSTNTFIHWRPILVATSASGIMYTMSEAPVFTGGTDVTSKLWNRNRGLEVVRPTKVMLHENVSVTEVGTILEEIYIGEGGNRRNSAGGDSGADQEILLDAEQTYLINVENDGGVSSEISLYFFWYEEHGWDGR